MTWVVALAGLALIGLLAALQLVAVVRPRSDWTIENVYGGSPDRTDPKAYFAFNQGSAWADPFFWAPLQIAGSIGMLLGHRWGFLLALAASVPFLLHRHLLLHLGPRSGIPTTHDHVLGVHMGHVAGVRRPRGRLHVHPTPGVVIQSTNGGNPASRPRQIG